jgi:hypothetical protein
VVVERVRRSLLTLAALALLAGACGQDAQLAGIVDAEEGPAGDLGGFGAPAATPGTFSLPDTYPMAGTLDVDERGCWRLEGSYDGALVVLPSGFELGPSGEELRTPDGEVLASGTPVDAIGAMIPTAPLPDGPDGRWSSYIEFCAPDTLAIAVLEELHPVGLRDNPPDDVELVEQLTSATLDTHWPCGYGFAVSDAAQRVGLFVQPTTPEPPEPGTVTLPDERFTATVIVGEHLFVNHCDDVMEWFEPEQTRLAEWDVVSGRFDYRPEGVGGVCSQTPSVTTVLSEVRVATPTGPVALGPIELVNEAFGCFAG